MIQLLGILTVIFFLLASLNGAKKYIKSEVFRKIAKPHRYYGMIASLFALLHFILNILNGTSNIIGFLILISLFLTGFAGFMFKKFKNKNLYILHRVMGPITLVLIIIHIITN